MHQYCPASFHWEDGYLILQSFHQQQEPNRLLWNDLMMLVACMAVFPMGARQRCDQTEWGRTLHLDCRIFKASGPIPPASKMLQARRLWRMSSTCGGSSPSPFSSFLRQALARTADPSGLWSPCCLPGENAILARAFHVPRRRICRSRQNRDNGDLAQPVRSGPGLSGRSCPITFLSKNAAEGAKNRGAQKPSQEDLRQLAYLCLARTPIALSGLLKGI